MRFLAEGFLGACFESLYLNNKGLQMRGKEFNELGCTINKVTDIGLQYWGSIPGEGLESIFSSICLIRSYFGSFFVK